MKYTAKCAKCSRETSDPLSYRCTCGKPLEISSERSFRINETELQNYSVWRYARSFPYVNRGEAIVLGEGWTPLVRLSDKLFLKLENLNPTGSFKDRGSTVLISTIWRSVKKAKGFISEDSSGNAGASIAAYAAHAGLRARIYVPETVSGPKLAQIQLYGAEVAKVRGDRGEVAEEAEKTEKGKFYIGHIFHPIFRDGIRSLAYEIAEQLGWRPPERIYLPVSAGTLLLGVNSGFRHLVESRTLKTAPKIVACQTRQVSPLYHRIRGLDYVPPARISSIADALVSTDPPLLDLMEQKLKEIHGDVSIVDEHQILQAFHELARRGFLVEPSSAVAYAAYKKHVEDEEDVENEKTVVILTGTGLKAKPSRKPEI